jgi:hypothetical protein
MGHPISFCAMTLGHLLGQTLNLFDFIITFWHPVFVGLLGTDLSNVILSTPG